MKKEIMNLFIEKRYSAYDISVKLECSIKEVYHYIKQNEDQVRREYANKREN